MNEFSQEPVQNPINITLINNSGGGFADRTQVEEGTTIQRLVAGRVSGDPAGYLIRVNRQPVQAHQVLREGDRVSITPNKIAGA